MIALMVVGAFVWAGCGGGDDECAGVDCEFGTCDSESGECQNPESCERTADCLPGYACGDDDVCAAIEGCSDDEDCEVGACDDGACVNPERCRSNEECLERSFCGPDQTCRPDPCNDKACERGTCERGTGECVSEESCTQRTQDEDCVEGERCAGGECVEEDDYCDQLECERGECSFEEGGCVNADDCDGDDSLCVDGDFCNADDECQADLCEQRGINCDRGGECVPDVGECEHVEPCEEDDDCVNGDHVCVEEECRLEERACGDESGDGGCAAGQRCEIEDGEAECIAPDTCETSRDCPNGLECAGASCLEPSGCDDDLMEPNDAADEATDFVAEAEENSISASLCEGDTDFYTFESNELFGADVRGQLLVEVDIPSRDLGLGELEVTLTDEEGDEVAAETNGEDGRQGSIRLQEELDATDHQQFRVEISGADELNEAGVDYDLSVNLVPSETLEACDEAKTLTVGERVSGHTSEIESAYLGSRCTNEPNTGGELVYVMDVDEPRRVTFDLEAEDEAADLTMSLRSRCTQPASETACVDDNEAGESETMTAFLEEGTHYLIVQSPEDASGGPFQLTADDYRVRCVPGSDRCLDENTSEVCALDGGRYTSFDCGDADCDATTGRCDSAGDICETAEDIYRDPTSDDEEPTYSEEIDLRQVADDYRVEGEEDGCLGDEETQSDGPDKTYRVDLPPGEGFNAEVDFGEQVEGSMYVVEDCDQVNDSCATGANGSTDSDNRERLEYANLGEEDETVYLVIDTAADQYFESAELDVEFDEVTCEPGEDERCSPDSERGVETCSEYGINWEETSQCAFACSGDAECEVPDDCDSAVNVTDQISDIGGTTFSGNTWGDFEADYDGSGCDVFDNATSGSDAVVEVDMEEGDVLRSRLRSPGGDLDWSSTYVMSACDNLDNRCYSGTMDAGSDAMEIYHQATSDETVYVFANSEDSMDPQTDLEWELELQEPSCDEDSASYCADDKTQLECNAEYGIWQKNECLGCDDGECPSGDTCDDAYRIGDGDSHRSYFDSDVQEHDMPEGTYGDCSLDGWSELVYPEYLYEIELRGGETLTVDYESGIETDTTAQGAMMLLDECGTPDSCLFAEGFLSNPDSLTYTAERDASVYLAVYWRNGPTDTYDYQIDIDIE